MVEPGAAIPVVELSVDTFCGEESNVIKNTLVLKNDSQLPKISLREKCKNVAKAVLRKDKGKRTESGWLRSPFKKRSTSCREQETPNQCPIKSDTTPTNSEDAFMQGSTAAVSGNSHENLHSTEKNSSNSTPKKNASSMQSSDALLAVSMHMSAEEMKAGEEYDTKGSRQLEGADLENIALDSDSPSQEPQTNEPLQCFDTNHLTSNSYDGLKMPKVEGANEGNNASSSSFGDKMKALTQRLVHEPLAALEQSFRRHLSEEESPRKNQNENGLITPSSHQDTPLDGDVGVSDEYNGRPHHGITLPAYHTTSITENKSSLLKQKTADTLQQNKVDNTIRTTTTSGDTPRATVKGSLRSLSKKLASQISGIQNKMTGSSTCAKDGSHSDNSTAPAPTKAETKKGSTLISYFPHCPQRKKKSVRKNDFDNDSYDGDDDDKKIGSDAHKEISREADKNRWASVSEAELRACYSTIQASIAKTPKEKRVWLECLSSVLAKNSSRPRHDDPVRAAALEANIVLVCLKDIDEATEEANLKKHQEQQEAEIAPVEDSRQELTTVSLQLLQEACLNDVGVYLFGLYAGPTRVTRRLDSLNLLKKASAASEDDSNDKLLFPDHSTMECPNIYHLETYKSVCRLIFASSYGLGDCSRKWLDAGILDHLKHTLKVQDERSFFYKDSTYTGLALGALRVLTKRGVPRSSLQELSEIAVRKLNDWPKEAWVAENALALLVLTQQRSEEVTTSLMEHPGVDAWSLILQRCRDLHGKHHVLFQGFNAMHEGILNNSDDLVYRLENLGASELIDSILPETEDKYVESLLPTALQLKEIFKPYDFEVDEIESYLRAEQYRPIQLPEELESKQLDGEEAEQEHVAASRHEEIVEDKCPKDGQISAERKISESQGDIEKINTQENLASGTAARGSQELETRDAFDESNCQEAYENQQPPDSFNASVCNALNNILKEEEKAQAAEQGERNASTCEDDLNGKQSETLQSPTGISKKELHKKASSMGAQTLTKRDMGKQLGAAADPYLLQADIQRTLAIANSQRQITPKDNEDFSLDANVAPVKQKAISAADLTLKKEKRKRWRHKRRSSKSSSETLD